MAPRPDDDEAWDAEHVLGVKKNLRKKTVELLVKWKGKPNSKNNWETITSINGLTDDMTDPFDLAIETLRKNKRTDLDEEVEDKEMGQDEYVVEDILGIQWNVDNRQLEYYIKWEGWDNQFNNWEPESNCDCDDLINPFRGAADHLKTTFGPKNRKRAGPKSRTAKPASDVESDDEPVEKKRPGPKSKTVASKRPGPKSRTETPAKSEAPKRPGPKSRTAAGPASSKRPGPKSRTAKADSDEEQEKKVTRKSDSDSDDDAGGDKNGSSRYKKLSDSDDGNDSDRASTPPAKKRPGPKSRTSAPGPASKKKPGPKSRTAKDDDDSD